MKKIMFAWLGGHDFDGMAGLKPGEIGPIARAATDASFARIVLLNNYGPERDSGGYKRWLMELCESQVDVISIDLPSPTDFAAIYVAARDELSVALKIERDVVPVFHLSPGTPAMAAVWILLAKGPYPEAELIQTSIQQGVEEVRMPFNVFAEFIPDALKGADRKLSQLSLGPLPFDSKFTVIKHQCAEMKKIITQARLVARRNVSVLIQGATGTGKELLAEAIHHESPRSSGPFISVNCGAIPKDLFEDQFFGHVKGAFTGAVTDRPGYFEQANNGTLFLDEIGELSLEGQVKILRVLNVPMVQRVGGLNEKFVDIRIIAATNRDLAEEVVAHRFREDLFYRLAVAILTLPPLSEREGDIDLLLESMLGQINKELSSGPDYEQKKFSISAKNILVRHPWPGNAREMFNTIMRICVWCQGGTIQEEDARQGLIVFPTRQSDEILQKKLGGDFDIRKIQNDFASTYIRRALNEADNNKSRAAKLLGLENYQTLNNWMKKCGVVSG